MSAEEPDDFFRAYLEPLAVDGAPNKLLERWTGVVSYAEIAQAQDVPHLVGLVYSDAPSDNATKLERLWEAIREPDTSFNLIGRDEELRLLAAATLDYLFSKTNEIDHSAALALTTASFGGRLPANLKADLCGRARAEIDHIAKLARDRELIRDSVSKLAPTLLPMPKAVTAVKEGAFDHASVGSALEAVVTAANKALTGSITAVKSTLEITLDRLEMMDEETDVLWFAFSGISKFGNAPFKGMDPWKVAILAGREISDRAKAPLRQQVSHALLKHCGATEKQGAFKDAIEAISPDWIQMNVPREPSARLFPVHRALDRFREVAADGNWIAGWSRATAIPEQLRITPADLGQAFYLESALMRELSE